MSRELIIGHKDPDTYLLKFVDDKQILEMVLNKRYQTIHNDNFFHRRLLEKYPLLLNFKKDNHLSQSDKSMFLNINHLSYKQFYIEMVHFMSKLWEDFQIPYINVKNYNPKPLYLSYINRDQTRLNLLLDLAATAKDMKLIEEFLKRGASPNNGLYGAVEINNKELIQYFIDRGASNWTEAAVVAITNTNIELMNHFIDLGANVRHLMVAAGRKGNIKLIIDKRNLLPENLNFMLRGAINTNKFDIVNYLLDHYDVGNINDPNLGGYVRSIPILEFLHTRGLSYENIALYNNSVHILRFLIKRNTPIIFNDKLRISISNNLMGLLKFLVEERDIKITEEDIKIAIEANRIEMLKYFLKKNIITRERLIELLKEQNKENLSNYI